MEWVITLLVAGALLLLLETVLPGMIAGAIGLLCLIAGIVQSYVVFGARVGSYITAVVIAGLIIGTMIWARYFPTSKTARMFTSNRTVGDINAQKPELLHQTGTALTPLRPSGTALINGRRVDVVTEGSMVQRDTAVKVVAIEGMRVVVRALSDSTIPNKS